MSITDELRSFTKDPLLGYASQSQHIERLTAIADRIDAEHEAMLVDARKTVYQGYVELPKDADGEYIHIGDEMEWVPTCGVGGTRHGTVTGIKTDEVGDELFHEIAINDDGFSVRLMASSLRHHHAPTVEDVLYELINEWAIAYTTEDEEAAIAECAKRLQLKEEA